MILDTSTLSFNFCYLRIFNIITLAANQTTPFLQAKAYVGSLSQSQFIWCFISLSSVTGWLSGDVVDF